MKVSLRSHNPWRRGVLFCLLGGGLATSGCTGNTPPPTPTHQPAPLAPMSQPAPVAPVEPEAEAGRVAMSTAFLRGGDMSPAMLDQVTDQVVQAIKDATPMFRRCYAKALDRNPTTQGEVDIELVIKKDGQIGVLRSGKRDIHDTELINCTLRAFERLTLPTPPANFTIIAPMQFHPK